MERLGEIVRDLPQDDDDDMAETQLKQDPSTQLISGEIWKVRHRLTVVEWKKRWAVLYPAQLCYFKQKKDKNPKQVVSVLGSSIVMSPENADCPKREFSIALIHPQNKSVYLAANSAEELEKWKVAFAAVGVKESDLNGKNLHRQRTALIPGNRPTTAVKSLNLKTRAEKYIASKAATVKVGVDIVETFFGETGVELLETLHDFTATQADEDKAQELEKNILKTAAKLAVLVKNNVFTDTQLYSILPTVLHWCKTFISVYGTYSAQHKRASQDENLTSLIEDGWKIEEWLQGLIKPHLKGRSSDRIKAVFEFYLDEDLLQALTMSRHYETANILVQNVIELYHTIQQESPFDDQAAHDSAAQS
eukprot:c2503_g1_i1.p1 GENE.c2503_g1_i1~~c2503_g1_i1.p1  ORF type:complete len:379 (+),score=96.61 c2503_g1_i1:49-1137(+)